MYFREVNMNRKWLIDSLLAALVWTALLAVCLGAEPIKLVGPEKAEVGQAFDVSVENLTLDIAAPPPQLAWYTRCGRVTVRQRFEARVEGGKWVVSPYCTVTGLEASRIAVELLVVRGGVAELAAIEVAIGGGPVPPPPPPPPGKLTVLLVEETADRPSLPPAQRAVLTSASFRKFLSDKGHRFLGAVDKDLKDATGNAPPTLAPFFSAVGAKTPFIAIRYANGTIKAFPLPADEAATNALVTKEDG